MCGNDKAPVAVRMQIRLVPARELLMSHRDDTGSNYSTDRGFDLRILLAHINKKLYIENWYMKISKEIRVTEKDMGDKFEFTINVRLQK